MSSAKRRRVDVASSTLRKPFRSPLRTPIRDRSSFMSDAAGDHDQQTHSSSHAPTTVRDITKSEPPRSSSLNRCTSTTSPSIPDDEVTVLQKQYSALAQQLGKLRQDLDVAEQARKLHKGSQPDQLGQLTLKWRDIARSAADEIFHITSSRLRDTGAMQAWHKKTRANSGFWCDPKSSSYDDAQCSKNGTVEDRSAEADEDEDAREDNDAHEQQEQPFTMTIMLRQFNIDADLLGFDVTNEDWNE